MSASAYPTGFTLPHHLSHLPPRTPILIGFSGGADSTALLLSLASYAALHKTPLTALHMHHGIRGEEADRDAMFCRHVADQFGIPLTVLYADVPTYAKEHGISQETAGRELRYQAFAREMQQKGIPILALAHHANDHMETVLYRLLRGSGAKGLCGIPPVRQLSDTGLLIRPLIGCKKDHLLSYLAERGQSFCVDRTNLEDDCDRNRIRHRLVPVTEELCQNPESRFLRLSEALREDCEALDTWAETAYSACGNPDGLQIASLLSYPPAVRKRVYSLWLAQCGLPAPEAVHLNALDSAVGSRNRRARIDLPGKRTAAICENQLLLLDASNTTNTQKE